jgi:membrane-associated phospholipid phosphatase
MLTLTEWWAHFVRYERGAMLAAVVGPALGFVVVYLVAVRTYPGQWVDAWVFGEVQVVARGTGSGLNTLARQVLPALLAGTVAINGVRAVLRRRWRALGTAILVVTMSAGLAVVLQNVLTRPDLGDFVYSHNSLPSGHTAATAALAVSVALLWPPPRPWQVRGAMTAVLVVACAGNVVGYGHMPSDVVASVLLVASVAAASCWLFRAPLEHPPAI